ncbi:MAG: hypothetical protein DMF82_05705 [Acidobacteria bacterium]|nr:MAG: hypothetical protein DMF82_05705 [Acidobacteriota bacterium]
MRAGRAQPLQLRRRLEKTVKGARPARVLVQQVSLGLAAAGHQDPVEPFGPAPTRELRTSLPLAVDLEPDDRFELRQQARMGMEPQPQAGSEDVI